MSLDVIKSVFSSLDTCQAWSVQLIKIKNSKRNGVTYVSREISLTPKGSLLDFINELAQIYTKGEKELSHTFQDVAEYDGSTIDKTVYKISTDNELIKTEYSSLIETIANPDAETDPLSLKAQAYLLSGIINIEGEEKSIILISMQNPVTTLRHKYLHANGTFKEISDQVLSLKCSIDVLIIDDVVYMLTLAGENLFHMERAHKAVCEKKVQEIQRCDIINNFSAFSVIATTGHNPRKFVSFNNDHLLKLKHANSRKKMAKKFNIPLDGDKFDTNDSTAIDKIIKLLCDRGMVDPFDDNPREVAGSKKWE